MPSCEREATMKYSFSQLCQKPGRLLSLCAACGLAVGSVYSQEHVQQAPPTALGEESPVSASAPVLAAPTAPLTLEDCLGLGEQYQPALAAAQSSLAAAQTGQRSLNRMILPRFIMPDYKVRQQQSCLGVTIAQGRLTQAEWA